MFKLNFSHKIIIVSTILLLLALSVSTSINYISLKNNTQENLNLAIDEIGHSVAGNIANWLTNRLQIIEAVALNITTDNGHDEIFKAVQQAVVAGKMKNTYVGLASTGRFILDDLAIKLPKNKYLYRSLWSSTNLTLTDSIPWNHSHDGLFLKITPILLTYLFPARTVLKIECRNILGTFVFFCKCFYVFSCF